MQTKETGSIAMACYHLATRLKVKTYCKHIDGAGTLLPWRPLSLPRLRVQSRSPVNRFAVWMDYGNGLKGQVQDGNVDECAAVGYDYGNMTACEFRV